MPNIHRAKNNSYFSYTFKAAPEPSKHLLTTILYLSNDAKYESIFPASDIMKDFEIVNEMLRRRKIQKESENDPKSEDIAVADGYSSQKSLVGSQLSIVISREILRR